MQLGDLAVLRLELDQLAVDRGDLAGQRVLGELSGPDELVWPQPEILERCAMLALEQSTLALDARALEGDLDVICKAARLPCQLIHDRHHRPPLWRSRRA